jgi:acetyl-CoA carboxylase biotin carboxyl carrier protein
MSAMDRLRSGLFPDAAPDPAPTADAGGTGREAADASLLALIDRLAGILERSSLSELEVRAGETTLVLRKPDGVAGGALLPVVGIGSGRPSPTDLPARTDGPGSATQGVAPAPAAEPAGPVAHAVIAPLTGIYYASPSPTAPPFVQVGQEVVAGQVIGLIEAMKLFNEIKSDASGRISKVSAENGALVKAKQTLIEVVPL